MACSTNTYRVTSASYSGGGDMVDTVGFKMNRKVTWLENTPGNRITPCITPQLQVWEADVEFQEMATPGAIMSSPSALTILLATTNIAASKTVTLNNARPSDVDGGGNSGWHKQTNSFRHDAADAEDFSPLSIA